MLCKVDTMRQKSRSRAPTHGTSLELSSGLWCNRLEIQHLFSPAMGQGWIVDGNTANKKLSVTTAEKHVDLSTFTSKATSALQLKSPSKLSDQLIPIITYNHGDASHNIDIAMELLRIEPLCQKLEYGTALDATSSYSDFLLGTLIRHSLWESMAISPSLIVPSSTTASM